MLTYVYAFCCVLGLSVGQLLFKYGAVSATQAASIFAIKPFLTISAALALYGVTSILWVFVLQKIGLGRIYPMMALAFVLVPLGSHFVFDEKFSTQYMVGVAFICTGIAISTKS